MSFEIGAAFELGLGQLDKINKNLAALRDPRPIYKMVGSSFVAAGTGPDYVRIEEGPAVGRVWNILSLQIFGADDHTAVSGASAVFYGSSAYINSAPGPLIDVLTAPVAIPSTTWYSRQVVWLDAGELIQAICYATPSGNQVSIIANVAEYPVEAVQAMEIS